jgi:hypothetical protein
LIHIKTRGRKHAYELPLRLAGQLGWILEQLMSPHCRKPPLHTPKSAAAANSEALPSRILDALVSVAFVVVGTVALTLGIVLMAAFDGYRSAWESICQRDYSLAVISLASASTWSALGLSLVGAGIWWLLIV